MIYSHALIQDALICLHSFYAFVIHIRTSYTGCTDMPPFDPFRCPAFEASKIYYFDADIFLSMHDHIESTVVSLMLILNSGMSNRHLCP